MTMERSSHLPRPKDDLPTWRSPRSPEEVEVFVGKVLGPWDWTPGTDLFSGISPEMLDVHGFSGCGLEVKEHVLKNTTRSSVYEV